MNNPAPPNSNASCDDRLKCERDELFTALCGLVRVWNSGAANSLEGMMYMDIAVSAAKTIIARMKSVS